jgi:hypothetical protein
MYMYWVASVTLYMHCVDALTVRCSPVSLLLPLAWMPLLLLLMSLSLLLLSLLLLQRFMAQYGFVPAGGNAADRVGFEVPERYVFGLLLLLLLLALRAASASALLSLCQAVARCADLQPRSTMALLNVVQSGLSACP